MAKLKTFGKVPHTTYKLEATNVSVSTTGIAPATALFGRPIRVKLPCPVVMPTDSSYDPAALRERDAQQKLKIKCHVESKRAVRDCDIQIGDTVLVKQPK